MRPGRGTPREEAAKNQRERLFAAMVAIVAKKGFEALTVADLIKLSGVSRSAFYKHFTDKDGCFLAAMDALVEPVLETVEIETELADAEAARQAFERLIRTIVTQPAASKMYFELYAAGPVGVALAERMLDGFEALGQRLLGSSAGGEKMPAEIVAALIGGVQKVIHKRLNAGQEEELLELAPQLWEWLISYPPPPGSLRGPRGNRTEAASLEERQAGARQQERILRALAAIVAEKGYRETTVAQIVGLARTSQRSFYEHFVNKDDCLAAALDAGSSKLLAAALPELRGAPDWPSAVRDTLAAMFGFGVEEPEFAALGGVKMYARGKRTLGQREVVSELIEGLLRPGYELAPETPPVAAEAIGGAIYALLYEQARENGTTRRAERMVTNAVYVALAPFVGAEKAYGVARGAGIREAVPAGR